MSEDRKTRLAELRKNRANNRGSLIKASPESQEEGSQDASPPKTLPVLSNDDLQETTEDKEETVSSLPPTLELTNGETVEVVSQRIYNDILNKVHNEATSAFFEQEESTKPKVSYTKDMKDDLQNYYHKAEIRTNRAINKIIQDKLIQE